MTDAHLLEVKQRSLHRLTVTVPRVPRLTQQAAILYNTQSYSKHSSPELGRESREPWGTIICVYIFQLQTESSRPNRVVSVPGMQQGELHTVERMRALCGGVGLRVRGAPGQGLCFPQASPTSAPSFSSPPQQRRSEQGLWRKQRASFLLKEAEKRAGTRKGTGEKASRVGTAAEVPAWRMPDMGCSVPLALPGPAPWEDPPDRPCVLSK